MCLMIIEIGYNILKLDVNSPSTEPTLSSSEVSLVALASHGTQADSAAGAGTTASLGDKTVPDMVVGAQKVVNKTSIEVNNDVAQKQTGVTASHDAPEKLRCNITDISDIIKPVLRQSFADHEKYNLKLQILEIIPNDIYTKIRLSDSEFWLEVRLDKKFENYIKTGLVKKYDIVNKVSLSGFNQYKEL